MSNERGDSAGYLGWFLLGAAIGATPLDRGPTLQRGQAGGSPRSASPAP